MEAACESGKIVANKILQKNNKKLATIHIHQKPLISRIINPVDDLLYKNKLNSIVDLIIFIIILILLFNLNIKKLI